MSRNRVLRGEEIVQAALKNGRKVRLAEPSDVVKGKDLLIAHFVEDHITFEPIHILWKNGDHHAQCIMKYGNTYSISIKRLTQDSVDPYATFDSQRWVCLVETEKKRPPATGSQKWVVGN